MTQKISGTFNTLAKLADFSPGAPSTKKTEDSNVDEDSHNGAQKGVSTKGNTPGFHFNIQVHLPSNGSEETYLNIFNAVRKVFS